MTLRELVGVMNIADVTVTSSEIPDLFNLHRLYMFHQDSDPILVRYGDREVVKLTNIAKSGDTIWIR